MLFEVPDELKDVGVAMAAMVDAVKAARAETRGGKAMDLRERRRGH